MTYEEWLMIADNAGLIAREKPLHESDGRIKGNRIAIRSTLRTSVEKACVMAEEVGHYYMNAGDILDQDDVVSRKQEYKARLWAYDQQIGLAGIVSAARAGCRNAYEVAEFLGTTEEFLNDCISSYRSRYGLGVILDEWLICFEPVLRVYEFMRVMETIRIRQLRGE